MRRTLRLALVAVTVSAPVFAAGSGVELEGRFWRPDLSGAVEAFERGVGGRIDPASDLALDADDGIEGRVTFRLGRRHLIRLGWLPVAFSGDTVLAREIAFGGDTFRLDTRVRSILDVDIARLGWGWQLVSASGGRFRLGPLLEIKGIRGEASIAAADLPLPLAASADLEAGFGSAGLLLEIEPVRKLVLFAEATRLVSSDDADLDDSEAGVRFYPQRSLGLQAGFRRLDLQIRSGDDRLDLTLESLFFGLILRL